MNPAEFEQKSTDAGMIRGRKNGAGPRISGIYFIDLTGRASLSIAAWHSAVGLWGFERSTSPVNLSFSFGARKA
jgi:hypothetical protein